MLRRGRQRAFISPAHHVAKPIVWHDKTPAIAAILICMLTNMFVQLLLEICLQFYLLFSAWSKQDQIHAIGLGSIWNKGWRCHKNSRRLSVHLRVFLSKPPLVSPCWLLRNAMEWLFSEEQRWSREEWLDKELSVRLLYETWFQLIHLLGVNLLLHRLFLRISRMNRCCVSYFGSSSCVLGKNQNCSGMPN